MSAAPQEYKWLLEEPLERVVESIPDSIRELVELIGLENTIKLCLIFGGQSIYVRQFENTFAKLRNDRIRGEFNGSNHRYLCRKYGLSVSHIYEILRDEKRAEDDKQTDLFDYGAA
jgi:Mor family transcriptional regulator